MKALAWHGKGDIRCETVADPKVEHGRDAIVRVTACAICGSDLHLFAGIVPTMEKGDVMGHEMIIASLAILLILTHVRSVFVICVTLPLAVLFSFLMMSSNRGMRIWAGVGAEATAATNVTSPKKWMISDILGPPVQSRPLRAGAVDIGGEGTAWAYRRDGTL